MNVTEIRETLTSVSDAVPVPAPDPLAFRRRVTRVRRRRTAGRVAGAVAAVAVVASGAVVALGGDEPTHRTDPAPPSVVVEGGTPVLVEGRLRVLSDDGRLGPAGPAAARVVGTTAQGAVVLTDDGQLGRVVDGSLERLVPDVVRTAYLDGDAVVFENLDGLVRWWGIDPTVRSRASAQTEQGRLMAAAEGMAVIAQATGLMLHDAAGVHELFLDPEAGNTIRGVDAAEGVVAVRTDVGVSFFHDHGLVGSGLPGDRIGALAPDGHAYARSTQNRRGVELLDPRTANATPVEGPSGTVVDLGWSDRGELLVVVQDADARSLWRCSARGASCTALLEDATATLRLR